MKVCNRLVVRESSRKLRRRTSAGGAIQAAVSPLETLENRLFFSTWFVAPYGNDANTGAITAPFESIQHAATVAQPGDTVLIRAGTYHETVTVTHSGTASAPIIFEPYNGESVTIDGADPITGWSSYNGSIYSASQPWTLGEGSDQLFVNGQMLNEARYPNSSLNVSNPTWATASSVSLNYLAPENGMSTVTLYNSGLTAPAGALVGAQVHLALGQEWVDQVGTVIGSAPGSITVTYHQETSYQIPRSGNRFYIVGSFSTLNAAGEWYRDPSSGRVYLWDAAGDNPSNDGVEAKARLYGFDLSGVSNITVEGINLFACTINTNAYSSDIVLNHLTGTYLSHSIGLTSLNADPWSEAAAPATSGIILNGTYDILENSTIAFSSGNGVSIAGSHNTVQDCLIHDVAYEGGDDAGIYTEGGYQTIAYNTVYNTGRDGVEVRDTWCSSVVHNVIHDVGLQMTDLGGVYTENTNGYNTEIGYNVIYNLHSSGYGSAGVYLDNGSVGYDVDHNVVYNADAGLKMNSPCTNDQIVNNTFSGTQYALESDGAREMSGSTFINNIFVGTAQIGSAAIQAHNLFPGISPQFVNASGYNYQLLSTSPAINAGMVDAPYTNGYTGWAPDIGAYEYGVAAFAAGETGASVVVAGGGSGASSSSSGSSSGGGSKSTSTARPAKTTVFFAPSYTAAWGARDSGAGITFTNQWGWAEFKSVDFGSGVTRLYASLTASPTRTTRVQIRLDSKSAACVGMLTIPPGASARTLSALISKAVQGVHDVYLVLVDPPAGGVISQFTFG